MASRTTTPRQQQSSAAPTITIPDSTPAVAGESLASDAESSVPESAAREEPAVSVPMFEALLCSDMDPRNAVLAACSSASPMWTANAATVSPSPARLKRGDDLSLEIQFRRNGQPELLPDGSTIEFSAKKAGQPGTSFVMHGDTFAAPNAPDRKSVV